MMDTGTVRNMLIFNPNINWEVSASSWFYYKKLQGELFLMMAVVTTTETWPNIQGEHKVFP